MLQREEALQLLRENLKDEALVAHSLESEAVMRGLAKRLGRDEDLWGICGLLHDVDYTQTKDTPEKHGAVGADMLEGRLPQEAVKAVRAHNGEMTGTAPDCELDWALRCGETVTGLIHAAALVRPTGMEGMKAKSLKKKMKDKAFARSVSRDNIRECEKIGLDLGEFLTLSIASIAAVAPDVGLA